jgi:hypothetical protein
MIPYFPLFPADKKLVTIFPRSDTGIAKNGRLTCDEPIPVFATLPGFITFPGFVATKKNVYCTWKKL